MAVSSLSAKQLASLEKRLLAEPRVVKVEPAPAPPAPPTVPPSSPTPQAATVYFRPVLCRIGPPTPSATTPAVVTAAICSAKGSGAAATPVSKETAGEAVILPARPVTFVTSSVPLTWTRVILGQPACSRRSTDRADTTCN